VPNIIKTRVIDILISRWQITSMCIHEIMKTQNIEIEKSHQKGKYKPSNNDNTKREYNSGVKCAIPLNTVAILVEKC